MTNGRKTLCIIPARGGSKGLPGKNIRALLGKPLIAWTVEQALACRAIDTVLVSTDDPAIAEAARQAGAEVPFLRPAELARDDSPVSDAVLHALGYLGQQGREYDLLVLLEATSPLRKRHDLDDALRIMDQRWEEADCLVSLGEVHLENPFITRVVEGERVKPLLDGDFYQRQQLPKVFFPYGVIYAAKVASYREHLSFSQPRTIPYFIERWQNYEIDDVCDFLCIEAILQHYREAIA